MRTPILAVPLAAVAGLFTGSCATNSYHVYDAGAGYAEERVSETSWRISFVGSTVESQAEVEQQLLRRAAELTLQSGYDWFIPASQETEALEDIVVTGERPRVETGANVDAVWRPRWRQRRGLRWTDWDPQGAVAAAPETARGRTVSPADAELHYVATAEITMGRAAALAGAFDAREVLARRQ